MESFITFLVLLMVSAIATWLKNQPARPKPGDSTENQPSQRPQSRRTSWEEELRKVLEGEQEVFRPQRPPPVVVAQPPPMTHTPPMVIKPVIVPRRPSAFPASEPAPSPIEVSAGQLASLRESKQAYDRAGQLVEDSGGGQLAQLGESKRAYERASQLDRTVAQHIDRVPGQRVLATAVTRRAASPEITQVTSLFKNVRGARQAVMATIILGPPRSLDETPAVSW